MLTRRNQLMEADDDASVYRVIGAAGGAEMPGGRCGLAIARPLAGEVPAC